MASRRRKERDLEIFRRMRRERMMMMRHGSDPEHFREMEMEMMMYEREMMYRFHDEDFEPEPQISEEEQQKRQDRQELLYWISTQMLPSVVRGYGNLHDVHEDLLKFVRAARFKPMLEDPYRFEVHYISYRDAPTEDDLIAELCRFVMAAFNNRAYDYEKVFILLCGVEEDLDTKVYPLATGLPYLDMEKAKREEFVTKYKKLVRRAGTRRYSLKDAEFSTIDEGMTKLSIVQCDQKAACNATPIPPVAVLSIHPNWVFCHEWCYLFGTIDDNRRWHPKVYDFRNGRSTMILDSEMNEKMEMYLAEGYQNYRRSKGYI